MLKQSQNLHKVAASEQTTTQTGEQDNCTHTNGHAHTYLQSAAAKALLWLAAWRPFCSRRFTLCVCGWFASGAKDSNHVQYEKRADKLRTRSSAQRNGATSWGLSKFFSVYANNVCKGCATPPTPPTHTHTPTRYYCCQVSCSRFKCILANYCIYFNLKCPLESDSSDLNCAKAK